MLSISRLLPIVLCANAYLSTAVDAKLPSRFDMQLLNMQSLNAGDSFSYELLTSMGLSISPATDGLDVYTFSFDGAVVSANQLPTTTMGVADRLSYTLRRDPKSQEIFSNDIDVGAMRQVNAYLTARGGAQTRTGRWTERAWIFSPAYIDLPGENPNVAFNVRSASHDGSEIKIATYNSEQFSFRTTVGQTVRARFVGYSIAADDWRVPLASGFALIGDIEETDGGRIPLAVRKKTLSVHPVTGREYLDPTRYVDAGLARQIDVESVFDAGSKPQQVIPDWLSDIHAAALHANALSGAIAEGRSNPAPAVAVAGAIALDTTLTTTWNLFVDVITVVGDQQDIKDINPFDHNNHPGKIKGVIGGLTYLIGKGVEKASVYFGVDKGKAKNAGKITETALDVGTIFIPIKAASSASKVLTINSKNASKALRAAKAAKVTNAAKLAKAAGLAKKAKALSKQALKASRAAKKATKIAGAGKKAKALSKQALKASRAAKKATKIAKKVAREAAKSSRRSKVKINDLTEKSLKLQNQLRNLHLAQVAFKVLYNIDNMDKVNDFSESIDEAFPESADFTKNDLHAPIPAEYIISKPVVPDAFRNPLFIGPSTGGFIDAAITLPLRFRLFDSRIEDGDIVRLEVRSRNGVNLNPTNVTLTNQGQIFSPTVAAGPVQVRLTAVNEGSLSPNTGGLNILSTMTRGPSNQNFSLKQGETGSLNIVASPASR